MNGINHYVEHWDSWYVSDIFTIAKSHFNSVVIQKNAYTEADLERFLTAYQRAQLSNILKKYGSGRFLPNSIDGFKKLLESTFISGIILAITPYQDNCLLCVTNSRVYAVIVDFSKERECCTLSIFMNENRINGYNQPFVYNVKKTYDVLYDYDSGFYVSIVETEKEAKEENHVFYFTAQYNDATASFERYIDGNLDFKMNFIDYTLFDEHMLDGIEDSIFQPELDIVTACFAYSVFCSRIIYYNVLPDEIEDAYFCKYSFNGNTLQVSSRIRYHKGEPVKKSIKYKEGFQ
jgi:hypothetical protein